VRGLALAGLLLLAAAAGTAAAPGEAEALFGGSKLSALSVSDGAVIGLFDGHRPRLVT